MLGNAWEWTADCWSDSSAAGNCTQHANRGGAWFNGLSNLRVSSRHGNSNSNRNSAQGFRLARD
jgi:formylglycine-generating enzyme required for sulfatase activity